MQNTQQLNLNQTNSRLWLWELLTCVCVLINPIFMFNVVTLSPSDLISENLPSYPPDNHTVADRPRDTRSLKVIQNYTTAYGVYKFLLVFHCNYRLYLVPFLRYSTSNNDVLFKSGLRSFKVIENDHIDHTRLPTGLPLQSTLNDLECLSQIFLIHDANGNLPTPNNPGVMD